MYVQFLWEKYYSWVFLYSKISSIQFITLSLHLVFHFSSPHYAVCMIIFTLAALSVEARQMMLESLDYLCSVWNWLDFFGNTIIIRHYVDHLNHIGYDTKGIKFFKSDWDKEIMLIGIALIGLRAASNLRIYKRFRVQIELLKMSIYDMIPFLCILFFMIFIFTLIQAVLDKDGAFSMSEFFLTFGQSYQIMLGENPNPNEDLTSRTHWIIYFGYTLLVNIVSLNLLISVISNTFDCVQASMEAVHCRTKAQILLEIATQMTWNRDHGTRMHLHFVHYSNEHMNHSYEEDEVAGRLHKLTG